MLRIPSFAMAVLAAAALGCVTMPAVDPGVHLRPETRPECVSACNQLGMDLGAIVLIRNAAGCVCQERSGQASASRASTSGGTAVAGGAYIVALEEQQRREEEEAHRRVQQSTPPPGTPGSPGHP